MRAISFFRVNSRRACSVYQNVRCYTHQHGPSLVEKFHPDDKDGYDKEEFSLDPRKNMYYYEFEIANNVRKGRTGLKKALELFREMKTEARLSPDWKIFTPLFVGCSRAGYTKKAFELYDELLKYEKKPCNSNITNLLNACAECAFQEYGLERLEWFLTELKVNFNHNLNLIQYNAAIKAYGKLGRLDKASELVQQMIDQKITPDILTFNSLLIGCASNKESGCLIALRVFKRLKMYDIKPDVVTYRLILRCIRDCELGSPELIQEIFRELPATTSLDQRLKYRKQMPKKDKRFRQIFEWTPLYTDLGKSIARATSTVFKYEHTCSLIDSKPTSTTQKHKNVEPIVNLKGSDETMMILSHKEHKSSDASLVAQSEHMQRLPNLLSDDHLDLTMRIEGLQLDKLKTKYDRLILFGGLHGFTEAMLRDGCKPDVKTMSLILLCLRPSKENFLEFFKITEDLKIQRDVDLYDQLIWCVCRNFRDESRLELALHFIDKLHIDNLRPTISTFEALSFGCNKWIDAKKIIDDMERSEFIVSHGMIVGFFDAAASRRNYHFLKNLLKYSQNKGFEPTEKFIERLEALRVQTNRTIGEQERDRIEPELIEPVVEQFDEFSKRLDDWMQTVKLREKDHPWEQYHVPAKSTKAEFYKFVKHMNTMEKLKRDTLKQGKQELGNVAYEAEKLMQHLSWPS